jgi:hypothetical protein
VVGATAALLAMCLFRRHPRQARQGLPTGVHVVTDGVVSAIELAKAVAGDKTVGRHGATVMQQALPLGLVDEIRVHVIPVLPASESRLGVLVLCRRTDSRVVHGAPGARCVRRRGPSDIL